MIDLSTFHKYGYQIGRNKVWQIAWHLTSHFIFQKYWLPGFIRPFILRFFGAKIGSKNVIRSRVKIHWPWKLQTGDYVWLGEGVWLLNLEEIKIGSSVCISQEAFLCTGSHDFFDSEFKFKNAPIVVEDSVWICARALVLAGAHLQSGVRVNALEVFK